MEYEPEVRGQNFFDTDANLRRLLARRAPGLVERDGERLSSFGAWVGGEVDAQAEYTNRFAPPVLATWDREGALANRIEVNPRYEAVHREVYERGIVGLNYGAEPRPFLLGFVMGYLLSQADISIHCPVTLTGAVAYVLDRFAPKTVRDTYLHDLVRMDGEATTGGTWATEQHGGSDVGATATVARRDGSGWRLTGLKWFASNAGSGLALATARPEGAPEGGKGLGLYLVPSHFADGAPNGYRVRRLKEKLGTRGLATGEIDLIDAHAVEIAAPPQGLKTMMEALGYSRIHNAVAAAGVQRRAFLEAVCWASHREAFGDVIINTPMVQDTLLDLLMHTEAGLALAIEAAHAFDAAQADPDADAWLRTATVLAKYLTAEQAIIAASSAIEVVGGNGYTEEYATARLLRDAQVLTVWEGPANIQALELLRLIGNRYPGFEAFESRVSRIAGHARGTLDDLAAALAAALDTCRDAAMRVRETPGDGPRLARKLLDAMSRTLAGALLIEEAIADLEAGDGRKALVARLFVESQLARGRGFDVETAATWPHEHFRQIAGYEPIAPRDARAA